ncbi:MAG TPA: VWA domain-containing protein [Thermoanaerobaculia bacterium]|jgi:VWFA-related protein
MSAKKRFGQLFLLSLVITLPFSTASASTQLLLSRADQNATRGQLYTGVIDLTVDPGFDSGKVTITVDGQKIAEGLHSPYRVVVDFGATPIEHKITVTAITPQKKRVQWSETINKGHLPLTVRLKRLDEKTFEAVTTARDDDPIQVVQLWDNGRVVSESTTKPYQFEPAPEILRTGFVQVTAKTKGGDEAADFWSDNAAIVTQEIAVRTVPIFVSVVDRNGVTQDHVDQSYFKIVDNGAEGKIIEFGKAFDQPISIALLLDASASMTYEMENVSKAATSFIEKTLRKGDRCSLTAVQDVPRRAQPLTDDSTAVAAALQAIKPRGRTALYDAIQSAVRELQDEKRRRAIVIMTDGSDTASIASFDEASQTARQAGIPIYFIAYATDLTKPKELEQLKYLAAETGGFVAVAAEQQDLVKKYHEIEKDLRAQFAILYQVTDIGQSNEWRNVRVVLKEKNLSARTIKGYFAP